MAQVETKVTAGTGAAAVSGLALWALGNYVLKGGVPDVVASWVYVLVPAALTFGAGYLARHTDRAAPPRVGSAGLPGIATLGIPPTNPANRMPPPEKTLIQPSLPPADGIPPVAPD